MNRTLPADLLREVATRLELAHKALDRRYPGWSGERRPVHVVYGGAHLFKQGTTRRLGELALRSLDEFAPDFASFAKAVGMPGAERVPATPEAIAALSKSIAADAAAAARENFPAWLAHTVYGRVQEKLRREPVEDYRIDFEDGYGNRPDAEEDAHAAAAARELAAVFRGGEAPPYIGFRVKPLSEALRERSLRTLDIFLTELAAQAPEALPQQLRVTLPKVTLPDEVAVLADVCSRLEPLLNLQPGALRIEIMVESPRAIFSEHGEVGLLSLAAAARGRCIGLHFGPYDYTSSLEMASVTAPGVLFASDFAREVMHVAAAGTGLALADGPVNIMPIAPHRAKDGETLTAAQQQENRAVVHRAWRLHFEAVRRSMASGFFQGWDLHPAQLPSRYAAVYSFFLESLDLTARRLRNFIEAAAQATRLGQVFDDAAMAQGLLNYFVQAVNCGAVTAEEVQSRTTLSLADLRSGSFLQILAARR
jgi:citrate lyase beta subunit